MPGEEVVVHVDRGRRSTAEATADSLETGGSFEVVLQNGSKPVRAHCRVDGDLAEVASIEQPNYYVEPDGETRVPVRVDDVEDAVEGTVEVSIGYGAATASIDVAVTPGPAPVDVDDRLAEPRRTETEPTIARRLIEAVSSPNDVDLGTLGVIALGTIALGIATATAAVVGGPAAIVGFLVVAGGIAVATFLLLW